MKGNQSTLTGDTISDEELKKVIGEEEEEEEEIEEEEEELMVPVFEVELAYTAEKRGRVTAWNGREATKKVSRKDFTSVDRVHKRVKEVDQIPESEADL